MFGGIGNCIRDCVSAARELAHNLKGLAGTVKELDAGLRAATGLDAPDRDSARLLAAGSIPEEMALGTPAANESPNGATGRARKKGGDS